MNIPDYQPPPSDPDDCEHGCDAWTLCDECLTDLLDENSVLGRFRLIGVGAGLALDIKDDGQVVVYMLNANTVVYGDGGVCHVWVTTENFSLIPTVELVAPTEPVTMATRELADFCELASNLATALLPLVQHAAEMAEPEAHFAELVAWLCQRQSKLHTRRMTFAVLRMLVLALTERPAGGAL